MLKIFALVFGLAIFTSLQLSYAEDFSYATSDAKSGDLIETGVIGIGPGLLFNTGRDFGLAQRDKHAPRLVRVALTPMLAM